MVLSHEFAIQPIDGKGPEEVHTSSMVCYGEEDRGGPSAMAKTVGLPAGMAVELILNGKYSDRPRKEEGGRDCACMAALPLLLIPFFSSPHLSFLLPFRRAFG